jgi:hypothetical protein
MTTPAITTSPGSTPDKDAELLTNYSKPQPEEMDVDDNHSEEDEDKDPDEKDILHGMKLVLAFVAMLLSLFLVALDGVSHHVFPESCLFSYWFSFQTIVGGFENI